MFLGAYRPTYHVVFLLTMSGLLLAVDCTAASYDATSGSQRNRRNADELLAAGGPLETADDLLATNKRKWERNTVRVWGKRAGGAVPGVWRVGGGLDYDDEGRKRTWSKNRVRVWGKRTFDDDNIAHDGDDKRSWSDNTVRVWGKKRAQSASTARADDGDNEREAAELIDKILPPGIVEIIMNK